MMTYFRLDSVGSVACGTNINYKYRKVVFSNQIPKIKMAALPPIYRTYIRPETLPEKKSYPAPEGVSLVTSTMYSKILVFTEEDNRGRIPINKLEQAVAKALSSFYLFAGRLSPQPRGRYVIQDFEKGCLFQVCESSDSLQEYKKNHFGYKNVPVSDFMPIHNYTSFDLPLVAVQLTQLQGGQALGYSFNHRIADGLAVCYFLSIVAQYMRNEAPSVELYYDWQRSPVQPNHRYDHSIDYPVVHENLQVIPERYKLDDTRSIRRVFAISDYKAKELKSRLELELADKDATISLRDAVAALFHQSIVKARRIKGRCDLLYMVSKRRQHPDKRLMNHFGNYFV